MGKEILALLAALAFAGRGNAAPVVVPDNAVRIPAGSWEWDNTVHVEPIGFVIPTPESPFGSATFVSDADLAANTKLINNTSIGDLNFNINFFRNLGFKLDSQWTDVGQSGDIRMYYAKMVR